MSKNVAIVHNGVIQNCAELRAELEQKGVTFVSETDSEIIAQLIGRYIEEGMKPLDAVKRTQQRLVGTWGCVVLTTELPDKLIAMKNGSPLLIGIGKNQMFLASEAGAFARYTKEFIALQDMEIAVIGPGDGATHLDLSRVEKSQAEIAVLSPAPFEHWTIKEIVEQPIAVASALNYGGRIMDELTVKLGGLDTKREYLRPIKHLIVTACGTSLFAGMYGVAVMRELKAFHTSQAIDAAELTGDCFPPKGSGVLALSQSGETKDVHRALKLALEHNVPCFSVVNVVGSLIARTTACGIYINAGREVAVASTKAFTSQVTCLCLAALWFAQQHPESSVENVRRTLVTSLQRLPTVIGMALQTRVQMQGIARRIVDGPSKSIFVLGKGTAEPVAREGALKIKEITYFHAEGYSGGALKHGPFALIEDGTPIILVIPDDAHAALMSIAVAEVKTRGAYTVVITDNPVLGKGADEVVVVPSNGLLTALSAVVPIQLLAYEMSVLRGLNPDKPRNLAKAITVD